MDRRYFVLTNSGEQGPFTAEDLQRAVLAGTVFRGDVLRTAMGKASGTVGDLLGVQRRISDRLDTSSPVSGNVFVGRGKDPRTLRASHTHIQMQRLTSRGLAWWLPILVCGAVVVISVLAALATSIAAA